MFRSYNTNYLLIFLIPFFLIMTECSAFKPSVGSNVYANLIVTSPSFNDGNTLAAPYSDTRGAQCSGANNFPGLSWSDAPIGTVSFVVIVDDPDGGDWVHLNLYNISPAITSIAPIVAAGAVVTFPAGQVGNNSWVNVGGQPRTTGWAGPCPPASTHTYIFTVYALDRTLTSLNDTSRTEFVSLYSANILASGQITARF